MAVVSSSPEAPKPQYKPSSSDRMRQTVKAMLYSVLATLAIVVAIIMLNPSEDREFEPNEDVAQNASEAEDVADFDPAVIDTPEDWRASYARWYSGQQSDVPYWDVGYVTEQDRFVGFSQTADANPSWIQDQLDEGEYIDEREFSGEAFDVYQNDAGWVFLVSEKLTTNDDGDPVTVIVSASAADELLEEMTELVVEEVK